MSDTILKGMMIAQVVISVIMVIVILMQNRGDSLSGFLGGGGGGESFRTKRGMEKLLYYITIILAIAFVIFSLVIVKYTEI